MDDLLITNKLLNKFESIAKIIRDTHMIKIQPHCLHVGSLSLGLYYIDQIGKC